MICCDFFLILTKSSLSYLKFISIVDEISDLVKEDSTVFDWKLDTKWVKWNIKDKSFWLTSSYAK